MEFIWEHFAQNYFSGSRNEGIALHTGQVISHIPHFIKEDFNGAEVFAWLFKMMLPLTLLEFLRNFGPSKEPRNQLVRSLQDYCNMYSRLCSTLLHQKVLNRLTRYFHSLKCLYWYTRINVQRLILGELVSWSEFCCHFSKMRVPPSSSYLF